MANTTAEKTPISLANLARNNDNMKEYIQGEIDKISVAGVVVDDALSNTSKNPVQNKVIKEALDEKINSSDVSMVATTGSYNDLTDKPTSMTPTAHTHAQSDITGLSTALSDKSDKNHTHTKSEITDFPTSLPASDVKAWAKADTKPTYTASEVGADASGSANTALTNAKSYTDTKIADLINGAPSTLDTLGEIATAMEENQTVVEALNSAIGTKANSADLTSHINDTSNPHSVTKSQVGLGNVPNVATNDQTPSYTEASSLTKLSSGEKLSVAFGKISKAITDLISHIADSVKHITSTERTNWNAAKTHADSAHAPSNAQANVIETVKVNGTALTPSSKAVDITVPSVGNGTITITQNGTTKGTFTTNQSGNATIALTDNNTTYSEATTSNAGLLSASDKSKLDGIASGANAYTHPTYTAKASGLYKVTVDSTGHVSNTTAVTKSDITALGIPASDTNTHYTSKNVVGSSSATSNTTSALTNGNVYLNSVENGAVTSSHKISGSGATTVTSDANGNIVISSTDNNTTYSAATQSANGLMSAADKKKLDGIATGATANIGTITGIKMNGASKGTSGVVDLGTVLTAHQSLSGYVPTSRTVNGKALSSNISLTASDIGAAASSHTHSYVPLSGGTMTGALVAQSNTAYTTAQVRNTTMSTSKPSGGSNGQIHYQYS